MFDSDHNEDSPVPPCSPIIPVVDPITYRQQEETSTSYTDNKKPLNQNKNRVRRKHSCTFCDQVVGNFARHLERHHSDEVAVQEFLSLQRNSAKRKKLIDKLRREGDFCTSEVIPVMNSKKKKFT